MKDIEYQYKPPRQLSMRIFRYKEFKKSIDILSIANAIFELEKEIKKKVKIDKVLIERFVNNHKCKLAKVLSEIVSYVLLESVEFGFYASNKKLIKTKTNNHYTIPKKPRVAVLFSGGVDSLSGIYWAKKKYSPEFIIEGIFCAHADQARIIHIVNNISNQLLSRGKIKLTTIHVPPITKNGYAQLRGFLYILSAGAWMEIINSNTLVISECGPTMYQPRFGPFDIVTMTTHPIVIEAAQAVLELLLSRKIHIITPFENMTKAEVIGLSPFKNSLKKTHSCVTQRFGKHDGTCYGCIIRRLGAITAGVEDTEYINNPISDERANKENLVSVLLFSQDILLNYEGLSLYEVENIESYNKKELFTRFALDNFAAIHVLIQKGIPVVKNVERIYRDCVEKIGSDTLDERIETVRKKIYLTN